MMAFRVGQKVICIEAAQLLVRGKIYTVSWIAAPGRFVLPTIWLVELPTRGEDGGYFAYRFRPIVERKTDISIFTKMLTGTKAPAHTSCL